MTPLASLLQNELLVFALECARVAGMSIVAPLGWTGAPNRIRVGLVLMVAYAAHGGSVHVGLPEQFVSMVWALTTEFGLGVAVGFVVRCAVAIAETAGETISPLIGLGAAHVFDVTSQSTQVLLVSLFRYLTLSLALITGVHRVVFGAILSSFELLPVGTAASPARALPTIVEVSGLVVEGGLRIALPVIAILFMTQVALAFVARAAPQVQIFSVGFAVTLMVGFVVLIMALPDLTQGMLAELSRIGGRIEALLIDLGARP